MLPANIVEDRLHRHLLVVHVEKGESLAVRTFTIFMVDVAEGFEQLLRWCCHFSFVAPIFIANVRTTEAIRFQTSHHYCASHEKTIGANEEKKGD